MSEDRQLRKAPKPPKPKKRKKRNWAPYLLLLPSAVYLGMFFVWPMFRALSLAVFDEDAKLALHEEADQASTIIGTLPQGSQVGILEQQGNFIPEEELKEEGNILTETWFHVEGLDGEGETVQGWAPETRVRVREEDETGAPVGGTVRRKLGSGADPLTSIYSEPSVTSEVVAQVEASAEVAIGELAVLEVWYQIQGEEDGQAVEGWAPSRSIQVFGDEVTGRVDRGNLGELTLKFFEKMVNDRFFAPAVRTTLLLMVLIIPVQFVLAVIMALVIQTGLRGSPFFLYVFSIPLGVSDLAVGILWFAVFTQLGYLNSILQSLKLIDAPITYLSADTRHWIIVAIWMAEVWRATSIVMIIVVSGLQAIPGEVLEAAELFGATAWQRLRHVTLPLLRPSLQVALILRTILAVQVFAVVVALGGGDVVTVLANETFRQYSDFRNPNVAATYAAFILFLSMVSAIIYLRMLRTQHEELAT